MSRTYRQLSGVERAVIMVQLEQGCKVRAIARTLQRAPSTISRELVRNDSPSGYHADEAQRAAAARRRQPACKLDLDGALWGLIKGLLRQRWSPQQIGGRLKASFPDQPGNRVSHETTYRTLYALPRGELRKQLIKALRQGRKTRRPRSAGKARQGVIRDGTPIDQRPAEVDDRQLPGHWEGDLIKGAFNRSAVGTLVERVTRLVILAKMDSSDAESALKGFSRCLLKVPPELRNTLTYDRGSEMARHKQLAKDLKIDIYFADPHSPWQRGSNENTNGLLRQYLPKGTDLSGLSQRQLDDIAWELNTRPRKALDFLMPIEAYQQALDELQSNRCT